MKNKAASLTPDVLAIMRDQATEPPFGQKKSELSKGTALCRQCGLALFRLTAQFSSGCGWPAFDKEIPGAVIEEEDADGQRDEIHCAHCHGHLGHVFRGEGFTSANLRHCVNALSLDLVASTTVMDSEEAILAAGCFWGVEYLFKQLPGVLKTEVGYTGGALANPTYEAVCQGGSGHYEALRVVFDPQQLSYEKVIQYFYEMHHPEQVNGQGPDIGSQYRSAIFVFDEEQKKSAEKITAVLASTGLKVTTQILPAKIFWSAEDYHQNYYEKTGKLPYCHLWQAKF